MKLCELCENIRLTPRKTQTSSTIALYTATPRHSQKALARKLPSFIPFEGSLRAAALLLKQTHPSCVHRQGWQTASHSAKVPRTRSLWKCPYLSDWMWPGKQMMMHQMWRGKERMVIVPLYIDVYRNISPLMIQFPGVKQALLTASV